MIDNDLEDFIIPDEDEDDDFIKMSNVNDEDHSHQVMDELKVGINSLNSINNNNINSNRYSSVVVDKWFINR